MLVVLRSVMYSMFFFDHRTHLLMLSLVVVVDKISGSRRESLRNQYFFSVITRKCKIPEIPCKGNNHGYSKTFRFVFRS